MQAAQTAPYSQILEYLITAISRPQRVEGVDAFQAHDSLQINLLSCLLEQNSRLCDMTRSLPADVWPQLKARQSMAAEADYIVCNGYYFPAFEPRNNPTFTTDRAATILVQVDRLGSGDQRLSLSGPGIEGDCDIELEGLHPAWMEKRRDWNRAGLQGVDMLLFDRSQILALPRTTHVIEP